MKAFSLTVVILFLIPLACFSQGKKLKFTEDGANEYKIMFSDTTNQMYLRQLRTDNKLLDLVKDAQSTTDKILAVTNWVSKLWSHNGNNQPEKRDPIFIIEQAKTGKQFRCVEYSIVVTGCLNAIGIHSRVLGLKRADVEKAQSGAGHVVSEAYIPELNKWVMIDGQWNAIPFIESVPLNAVELQQAISSKNSKLRFWSSSGEINKKAYRKWIIPYLFYFDFGFDQRYMPIEKTHRVENKDRLMLVPLGAKLPVAFQKTKNPDNLYLATYSQKSFYQAP
jgi:hypothetical protein